MMIEGRAFNSLLKIFHPKAHWKADEFLRDESYREQRDQEVQYIFERYFKELEKINNCETNNK
jgi:hypothetical protein